MYFRLLRLKLILMNNRAATLYCTQATTAIKKKCVKLRFPVLFALDLNFSKHRDGDHKISAIQEQGTFNTILDFLVNPSVVVLAAHNANQKGLGHAI